MTTPYIDPKLIFASDAPVQDKPARFDNYAKGWDESRKNDGRPEIKQSNFLQQQNDQKILYIHERGAALPYIDGFPYEENAPVVKDGVLVQKKGSEWKPVGANKASDILDESGLTQQEVNNLSKNIFYPLSRYYTKSEIELDFTLCLTNHIAYVDSLGGGSIIIDDGFYEVDISKGIPLKSNIQLILGINTHIKAKPTRVVGGSMFNAKDTFNVSISGGILDGNRDAMLAPDNKPWNQFKENTTYTGGQYVWIGRWGCVVTVAGTTGNTTPTLPIVPTIDETVTSGTVTFKCVEDVGEWGFGIDLRGVNKFHVSNCEINNWWGDGIYIGRSSNKSYCESVSLDNVNIDNCRRQGLSLITCKGFSWRGGSVSNINGTLPMAGIDIEPNLSDEWVYDISIENVTTSKCRGSGLLVSVQKLTDWSERVRINIVNHRDTNSNVGFRTLGSESGGGVRGIVKNTMCTYTNTNTHNAFMQNHNADGYQVIFEDCTFINNNDANTLQHCRISNAPADYALGGVHFIRPRFRSLNAVTAQCIYLYANNGNGIPNKNISVVDPVEKPASSVVLYAIDRRIDNLKLSDAYNLMVLDLSKSQSLNVTNIWHSYTLSSGNGFINVNSIHAGRTYIINNFGSSLDVNLNNNIVIVGLSNTTFKQVNLQHGGTLVLTAISSTELIVQHSFGVLKSAKRFVGNIPIGEQSFNPNETKLLTSVVGVEAKRFTDMVNVSSTVDLKGEFLISAQIVRDGEVSIYITNLKNTASTLYGTNNYANLIIV